MAVIISNEIFPFFIHSSIRIRFNSIQFNSIETFIRLMLNYYDFFFFEDRTTSSTAFGESRSTKSTVRAVSRRTWDAARRCCWKCCTSRAITACSWNWRWPSNPNPRPIRNISSTRKESSTPVWPSASWVKCCAYACRPSKILWNPLPHP